MQNKDITVVGLHSLKMALICHPEAILSCYVDKALSLPDDVSAMLNRAHIKIESSKPAALDRLSEGVSHQGIVAKVRLPLWDEKTLLTAITQKLNDSVPPLILILDGVHNPHNLGACLRSAEIFGAMAVVIPSHEAVALTPAVSKAACGAEQVIPLVQVSNLVRFVEKIKKAGMWVAGCAHEATIKIHELDGTLPLAIIMGQEGRGMRTLTQAQCDYLVKIPMSGKTENLNLSVAASVTLYEIARQRAL